MFSQNIMSSKHAFIYNLLVCNKPLFIIMIMNSFYSCKLGGATSLHIWASYCTMFRKVSEAPSKKKTTLKTYQFYSF